MGRKEELEKELSGLFEQWSSLQEQGGTEPFTEDGRVMNRLRERIVSVKKACEAELEPNDYPKEYHIATPPVVKDDYMARATEIKRKAKKSLEAYKGNDDYLWLKEHAALLDEEEEKKTGIGNVLDFPIALRFFIKTGSLVDMRRHEDPSRYIAHFRECRVKVEAVLKKSKKGTVRQQSEGTGKGTASMAEVARKKGPGAGAVKKPQNVKKTARVSVEGHGFSGKPVRMADPAAPRQVTYGGRKDGGCKGVATFGVAMTDDRTKAEKKRRGPQKDVVPEGQLSLKDMGLI